ncbi:hypothetical protein GUJ93_ZPchr0011g28148 [Zizania palustris]|uniref:Uncharacterized protein n=1 Tax=Zizania palustris TaxID=103762 RepID=A0A8J5WLS2_ZIZPA|nr:hypothetical protein GUJ93_ZPchr0011g28148 [Zizania palustris]
MQKRAARRRASAEGAAVSGGGSGGSAGSDGGGGGLQRREWRKGEVEAAHNNKDYREKRCERLGFSFTATDCGSGLPFTGRALSPSDCRRALHRREGIWRPYGAISA